MPGQNAYGWDHRRLRAQLAGLVALGRVKCWRCEKLIQPWQAWDLGHDDEDRSRYRGPEHRRCNRATNGRRPGDRPIIRRHSREW